MTMPTETFEYTHTGLVLHGQPAYAKWLDECLLLTDDLKSTEGIRDAVLWSLGDMLCLGEDLFPDTWSQACELYKPQTLRNVMSTCRRIPYGNRVEGVSVFDHAVVIAA